MTDTCHCIACRKPMTNIMDNGTLQPSGGTAFQTHGHYGSTVFDPMDGSVLEIAVCDDCLTGASRRGDVVLVDSEGARPNPADPADPEIVTERVMDGAGGELMQMSRDIAVHPEFAEQARRLHMIGAWITVERPSDLQKALVQVLGEIVTDMRARGFDFDYDKPITAQVKAFLDSVAPAKAG